MPLLRYQTGDIVQKFPGGWRLLGREGNLFFRADGGLVSPTELDAALPRVIRLLALVAGAQTAANRWDFLYVADETAPAAPLENALARALGGDSRVVAFRRKTIAPAASGKFALLKPLPVAAAGMERASPDCR